MRNVSSIHRPTKFLASAPQRAIALLMTLVLFASGCSTPDGGDIGELSDGIRELPQEAQQVVSTNKQNDRLRRLVADLGERGGFGYDCQELLDQPPNWARVLPYDLRTRDILQLLIDRPDWGLAELMQELRRRGEIQFRGNGPCTPVFGFYLIDGDRTIDVAIEAQLDEAREDDDEATDSAYWLPTLDSIQDRHRLYVLFGMVLVGGVLVAGPARALLIPICALSTGDHWSCPDSPEHPPGQTPQPDDGTN